MHIYAYFIEETYLGLELASTSYQTILQAVSHTIDLPSIQIDKYERIPPYSKLGTGLNQSCFWLVTESCL